MLKNPLRFKLRNQLIIVMLSMLMLFVASFAYLQQVAEEKMFDLVQDEINNTMKAIQISIEQIHAAGKTDEARLQNLFDHLQDKGIEEVSIIGKEQEVRLSSDPRLIGSRLSVANNEYLIQEKIGGDGTIRPKKIYSAFVPIISKGALEGYIHISMYFEDLEKLSREMLFQRMLWALPVLGLGMVLCILISHHYTKPIPALIEAVHAISKGDEPKLPANMNADIKTLSDSLKAMHSMLAEQKQLEEKLKKSENRAVLAQLASGIAHEIRNPLNFLSLSIDHLKNSTPGAEKDAGCPGGPAALMVQMKTEIQRVNQMIINFLDLGRELILHPVRLKAHLPVEEVLELSHLSFKERGITLERAYCDPMPEVEIDIDRMKSCFQNIVSNAAEAMPAGGALKISIAESGAMVQITFADSGSGIDPQHLPKIFEPYFTTKRKGIGLGLAIAKRMVESHQGGIEIRSTPAQGTSIQVSLPCAARRD